MKTKRFTASLIALLAMALLALAIGMVPLFAAKPSPSSPLVRAKFRNADDGLQSDGKSACGFDYVDRSDNCAGTGGLPSAPQASQSQERIGNSLWLRTVPACCASTLSGWEEYVVKPSRWLVLDFSQPELRPDGTISPCPNIDRLVADRVPPVAEWDAYGLPTPQPPPVDETDGCVDNVSVRFRGAQFLSGGGASPSLTIDIDEPQLTGTEPKRNKTSPSPTIVWNALYRLVFRGPLTVTTNAGVTTVQTNGGDSELADLFDAQDAYVGTYRMPFLLDLTPAQ